MSKRGGTYYGGSTLIDGRNKDWFSPKKRRKPRPEDSEPAVRRGVAILTGVQGGEPPRLIRAGVLQAPKVKRFKRRKTYATSPHGRGKKS